MLPSLGKLTRETFNHLFDQHLKPGGVYVIEDWGTGYWDSWPDGKKVVPGVPHNEGMVGFVKELIDEAGMDNLSKTSCGGMSPAGGRQSLKGSSSLAVKCSLRRRASLLKMPRPYQMKY